MLKVMSGDVRIMCTSVPDKHVTLTTQKVDIEAREINHHTRPVAYRAHIGDRYYVSVTTGYGCVDIRRFYIPYGLACEYVHPTRNGLGLRLDEWAHLLELVSTFHEWHPELMAIAESSDGQKVIELSMFTHYEDMKGDEKCKNCSGLGGLGVTQGHRKHRHLIEHI